MKTTDLRLEICPTNKKASRVFVYGLRFLSSEFGSDACQYGYGLSDTATSKEPDMTTSLLKVLISFNSEVI